MANLKDLVVNGNTRLIGTLYANNIEGYAKKSTVAAQTYGQSADSSGATFAIPYVTVAAGGIVTGGGTHSHTISRSDLGMTDFVLKYTLSGQSNAASVTLAKV